MNAAPDELRRVLDEARAAGFLGPGDVETHIAHAEGFAHAAEAAGGRQPGTFADLGTGGGVPGLVLALRWASSRGLFVESNHRRCAALRVALGRFGMEERVEVLEERAESAGEAGPYREFFEVVTARGFAEPAVAAEIAAGLVMVGGVLVVSEPPEPDVRRWPAERLGELGFGPAARTASANAHFVVVRKESPTPERFPRQIGRPAKRPLW